MFAPAAGRLATGGSFESLGTAITDPIYAPLPIPLTEGDSVVGEVLHVDRFGTLISNITGNSIQPGVAISVAGIDAGPLQRTFADVPSGHLVAFVGSGGTVEIAVRDGNAARTLGLGVGAEVRA